MMRYRFYVFLFLLNTILFKAQILDEYPKNQDFYEGGMAQFYKDLNQVFIKNGLERCNNRESEMFVAQIEIVDGKAQVTNKNIKEDCPTQLFMKGLIEINKLNNWKMVSDSQKFTIPFYPIDYFDNFKNGYTPEGLSKNAEFPGGMDVFRNLLMENIKKQNIKNPGVQIVIRFKISKDGVLYNIIIENPKDLDEDLKNKIIKAVEQIDTKWKPYTSRNTPVISNFRVPIRL
ncbi:energy transducer TonB [Chryseobacterium sp. 5_R23647]|uniref:energy transducer TonB n=1 Tax=Chryseobacterium sp. 5_R23647 TaxID=2258964 RepID=UPI000E24CC9B|nr:hypothetical protein [Chryseobacterium sp. 5_R23647]REC46024.1 hypothetical protein DRF69_02630 [Chryseobacterium sp. 5_R23647]